SAPREGSVRTVGCRTLFATDRPVSLRDSSAFFLRFRWPSRHRCPKGRFAEPSGCEVVPKIPAESRHDGAFVREPYDRVTLRRSLDRAPRGRRFSESQFSTAPISQRFPLLPVLLEAPVE